MKAYLLTLTGAILLSSLVSILIPDGKMGRFIKGMTRLFVFSIVIVPLASLFGENKINFSQKELAVDHDYLVRCAAMLEREDEETIEGFLLENYAYRAEVQMTRGTEADFPRKKLVVKISADGIFEPGTHIDMMTEIENVLEEIYGCPAEVIWEEKGSESS